MTTPLFECEGMNGKLQIYDNKITFIRAGLMARTSVGTGTKDVWMKNITGINIKAPGFLSRGYFQVMMQGSNEMRGNWKKLLKDENAIIIKTKHLGNFVHAKKLIEQHANK